MARKGTYAAYWSTRPWLTLRHTEHGPEVIRWPTHEAVIALLVRYCSCAGYGPIVVSVWRKAGKGWRPVGQLDLMPD